MNIIMKHTKGKWEVDQGEFGLDINNGEGTIGTIYGEDAEAKANANLIASAPEMLSLLKRFLEAPAYKEARDNTKWMLLEEMKAITANAEGTVK